MRLFSLAAVAATVAVASSTASAQHVVVRPAPFVVVPPPAYIATGGISLGYYSPGLNITLGRPAFYGPPAYGYGYGYRPIPAYGYGSYRPAYYPSHHHHYHR